jgi:ADP-ribose pyrophosphatase
MYSPDHIDHAEYRAGFPALILSGEGARSLAVQFATHGPPHCNVEWSGAVSFDGVSSNRSVVCSSSSAAGKDSARLSGVWHCRRTERDLHRETTAGCRRSASKNDSFISRDTGYNPKLEFLSKYGDIDCSDSPVDPPVIKAAGGILQRSTPRGDEVMVVYRKRHQDWTLPRGKVRDGESFQEAAMREVQDETGCSCRIGNYLGTISYSDNGVPKVVLFWKMTLVEDKGARNSEEIGEALWLQVPAAIERLTHAQEKALLSRVGSLPKQSQLPVEPVIPAANPVAPAASHVAAPTTHVSQNLSVETHRAHSRLLRECEAFRVELGFLERRSARADNFWAVAAHEQLNNVLRCLESDDIEGGWFGLHAAQRYAVFGMNQ